MARILSSLRCPDLRVSPEVAKDRRSNRNVLIFRGLVAPKTRQPGPIFNNRGTRPPGRQDLDRLFTASPLFLIVTDFGEPSFPGFVSGDERSAPELELAAAKQLECAEFSSADNRSVGPTTVSTALGHHR